MKSIIKNMTVMKWAPRVLLKIESRMSLDDCVKRLKSMTKACRYPLLDFVVSGDKDSQLAGVVSVDRVILVRAMPFGWRGKPHFYGKFVETLDGKVILEGYFGGEFVQRIAGWVSLIIVPTAEIIFILGAFSTGLAIGQRLLMVFFIPGALLIGFTVSKFIERFTSKDIEWISNKVREAL